MVASTVAVAFRIAARKMSSAKYGLDDLFILIALVGHPLHLHFNVAKQSSRAEKQIRSRYLPMEWTQLNLWVCHKFRDFGAVNRLSCSKVLTKATEDIN